MFSSFFCVLSTVRLLSTLDAGWVLSLYTADGIDIGELAGLEWILSTDRGVLYSGMNPVAVSVEFMALETRV